MRVTNPFSVEGVFEDFKGRRTGLIKALTDDSDKLFEKWDPEKDLCLYGYPDGSWDVHMPDVVEPTRLPHLVLGSVKVRDEMQKEQWLSKMAVPSDSWLLMVAFNFSSAFGFDKSKRKRLFDLIDGLPSVVETVNGALKRSRSQLGNQVSKKRKSSEKTPRESENPNPVNGPALTGKATGENEEIGQSVLLCSTGDDEIWICCEVCERWFRDLYVNTTHQYMCPSCYNNKRAKV